MLTITTNPNECVCSLQKAVNIMIIQALKDDGNHYFIGGVGKANMEYIINVLLKTLHEANIRFQFDKSNADINFSNGSKIILSDIRHRSNDPGFNRLHGMNFYSSFIYDHNNVNTKIIDIVRLRMREAINLKAKETYIINDKGYTPGLFISNNVTFHKPDKNY